MSSLVAETYSCEKLCLFWKTIFCKNLKTPHFNFSYFSPKSESGVQNPPYITEWLVSYPNLKIYEGVTHKAQVPRGHKYAAIQWGSKNAKVLLLFLLLHIFFNYISNAITSPHTLPPSSLPYPMRMDRDEGGRKICVNRMYCVFVCLNVVVK